MLSFLFEQYGYYPKNLENNTFFLDGWEFRLIEINSDEDYIEDIEKYAAMLRDNFSNKGPYLIKTRYNQKISFYDNKKFVLVSIAAGETSVNDLNKFHILFSEKEKEINLKELLLAWQTRSGLIEREGASSLKVDSYYYSSNLEITMFYLGLCQNAIQYLSEIIEDYNGEIKNITIAHKRIKDFKCFDFFNPFNLVYDHPIRDYVELYRNESIDLEQLINILDFYNVDYKIASLFMARLLYPIKVFDLLEENMETKEKSFKLNFSIEKELRKIKKTYLYFKQKYNIRPINWLEYN